ncbi:MAG: hypothetical protein NZ959_05345 [Armatimonadetes bacterium]|nr:hypothetical protein [Armatimonadota bacterium]MDW8122950.1 hypothetical protein [Armatimonadota bacterium]
MINWQGMALRLGLWLGGLLIVSLMGFWILYSRPEERITETIQSAARSFQKKEMGNTIALISPNYRDPYGYTYGDVYRFLLSWCRDRDTQAWVWVTVEEIWRSTFWDADARVQVRGVAMPDGSFAVPFGPVTVTISLERTWLGRWRIVSVYGWRTDQGLVRLENELTDQP